MTSHDPEDVARTTLKETGLADAPSVNLRGGAYVSTSHDPEDVARTTQKETQLFDASGAAYNPRFGRVAGPVNDPDNRTRVTGRETMLNEDYCRNLATHTDAGIVYDPDDWTPATTNKQVLTDAGRGDYMDGNVGGLQGTHGAYATTEYTAPPTNKQFTSDTGASYGTAHRHDDATGAYQVAAADVKDTQRQATSDYQYYGSGGTVNAAAQMSYANAKAARTNLMRELVVAAERDPTVTGVKLIGGAEQIGRQLRDPQRASLPQPNALDGLGGAVMGGGGGAACMGGAGGCVGGFSGAIGDVSTPRFVYTEQDRFQDEIAGNIAQRARNPIATDLAGA